MMLILRSCGISLLVHSWRTPSALLWHSWRNPGAILVHSWCHPGALLVHSWCNPGALLAHVHILTGGFQSPASSAIHFQFFNYKLTASDRACLLLTIFWINVCEIVRSVYLQPVDSIHQAHLGPVFQLRQAVLQKETVFSLVNGEQRYYLRNAGLQI